MKIYNDYVGFVNYITPGDNSSLISLYFLDDEYFRLQIIHNQFKNIRGIHYLLKTMVNYETFI